VNCEKTIISNINRTDYQSRFSPNNLACGAFHFINFTFGAALCFIKSLVFVALHFQLLSKQFVQNGNEEIVK